MVTFGPLNTLNMSTTSATVDIGRCVSRERLSLELGAREFGSRETVATGFRPLDRLLPAGGVRRGSLVEWLAADCTAGLGGASGAASIACAVACRLAANRVDSKAAGGCSSQTILVVDRRGWFHPPAVMGWLDGDAGAGQQAPQCIVARTSREDDEVWAIDQALRCSGVVAVLACPGAIHPTAMRRWQLAARSSGAVGLLLRPETARREPSWAEARIAVTPLPGETLAVRRLRLSLVGGPWLATEVEDQSVEIGIDLSRGRAVDVPSESKRSNDLPSPRCLRSEEVSCRAS
jgi:protein ImuA